MSTHTHPDPYDPNVEECLRLYKCWPWFLGLGVLLIVAGAIAVASPLVQLWTTYVLMVLFGCLLLAGFLHLVVGGLMIDRPERAAEFVTLMLAVAFLVGGAFRLVGAVAARFSGWVWVALNGAITLALGVAIWRNWPEASYWVIGLFVGIDLIFNGWSWVMLGLTVKASGPRTEAPAGVK